MDAEQLTKQFDAHWARKMRQGVVSALSVMERHTLKVAFKWLCEHYHVTPKTSSQPQ